MPKIAFYHQQRFDGGVRAGLGVDDQTVLHRFEPGREPSNPALEWYVDVIVTGRSLPTSSDEARDWLIEHADFIRRGMGKAAEQLEVGLDTDDDAWPFRWKLGGGPRGVEAFAIVSAVRRLDEGQLARRLQQVADQWEDSLRQLEPLVSVS
jgi:hypothetical protein